MKELRLAKEVDVNATLSSFFFFRFDFHIKWKPIQLNESKLRKPNPNFSSLGMEYFSMFSSEVFQFII